MQERQRQYDACCLFCKMIELVLVLLLATMLRESSAQGPAWHDILDERWKNGSGGHAVERAVPFRAVHAPLRHRKHTARGFQELVISAAINALVPCQCKRRYDIPYQ